MDQPVLRKYIRNILTEGLADVVAAEARIRVDVLSPDSPTYNDVLTGIRGIVNVITVRTEGHLVKAGGKKQIANIVVRYEAKPNFGPEQLEKQLLAVDGIDLARVKIVDGVPWTPNKGESGESPTPSEPGEQDTSSPMPAPTAKPKPKPRPLPPPTLQLPS